MASQVGESKNQIFRYIRLTELIPPILQMVDEGKIAFRPAVEISYLTPDEQEGVYNMRRALNSLKAEDAVEQILNMFSRTKNNEEFVQTAKKQKFL